MREAVLSPHPDGTVDVTIQGGEEELRSTFRSVPEACNFLERAGWHKEDRGGGNVVFVEAHRTLHPFVAVPMIRSTTFTLERNAYQAGKEWIDILGFQYPPVIGNPWAFCFNAGSWNSLDPDPILGMVSPWGVKIGGIGIWPTRDMAALMAREYVKGLERIYGPELFWAAVRAYLLGRVHPVEAAQ